VNAERDFVGDVRGRLTDSDHGIYHNGNDHRQGPLSNCPACAVGGVLDALDSCRRELAEALAENRRLREDLAEIHRLAINGDGTIHSPEGRLFAIEGVAYAYRSSEGEG